MIAKQQLKHYVQIKYTIKRQFKFYFYILNIRSVLDIYREMLLK